MIEYNPITPDVLEALREISGKRVITGEDINPDYTHDDMPIYGIGMPEATIDVESTEEIAAIMKLCNEHHIPVTQLNFMLYILVPAVSDKILH